jgi:hypothetical protein
MKLKTFGVAAMVLATGALAHADGIKWQGDLNKAMLLAKKLKKPIMVDFYADW